MLQLTYWTAKQLRIVDRAWAFMGALRQGKPDLFLTMQARRREELNTAANL